MLISTSLIACGTLAAAASCLLSVFIFYKRQRAVKSGQIQRIVALQQKIDAALRDDGFEATREAFSATLKTASLTTSLQRPRLENMAKIDKQPPEKYKILCKLASQGLDVEEIAAILGISRIEAGQLLSLSSMAKCGR